jgi:ubiquinone/menaquinone biosynthesis C-methylase UbiE
MKENLEQQWNEAAESWIDFVRTGKDYYRDKLNNPAMFAVLGDISGKKILDLGCGEGYNTRIMAKKGAHVTGIDFAERMIDRAIHTEREGNRIEYYTVDACDLHFENSIFDIVTCFMALQDIEPYQEAIRETYRVLKDGGRFVFVMPHPCFEKRVVNGTSIGGWEYEENSEGKTENALYYKVDRYFDTRKYTVSWNMKRLTHHFATTSFHRTITDYANALYDAGFLISKLIEPKPIEEGGSSYLELEKNLRIPQSIVIEAIKVPMKNEVLP